MISLLKILILGTGAVIALGCSSIQHQNVILTELEKLDDAITVDEVFNRFGQGNQGHGPYIWFRSGDNEKKEVWFWYLPENGIESIGRLKIVLVTLVDADDSDSFVAVWPKKWHGRNDPAILRTIYSG